MRILIQKNTVVIIETIEARSISSLLRDIPKFYFWNVFEYSGGSKTPDQVAVRQAHDGDSDRI